MSNDDRPSSGKSTKATQQNKISHRDRKHPWHSHNNQAEIYSLLTPQDEG